MVKIYIYKYVLMIYMARGYLILVKINLFNIVTLKVIV
jgi:hypothetical protein